MKYAYTIAFGHSPSVKDAYSILAATNRIRLEGSPSLEQELGALGYLVQWDIVPPEVQTILPRSGGEPWESQEPFHVHPSQNSFTLELEEDTKVQLIIMASDVNGNLSAGQVYAFKADGRTTPLPPGHPHITSATPDQKRVSLPVLSTPKL